MLPETFVLKIPETLPYGGSFQGPEEFDRFFRRIYDNSEYWSSFRTELALGRVLDAGSHLVAPLRVTGRAKSSGATITVENLWLFEIADGNFARAQLYADTGAARNV
ncbi:MAG TPA: nuclear transport factor 2 family protein [Streptosporangiaceae bacterium]|nr:nuclear transport factor 2 family protein [Streptosporangiaceae bacterium]